MDKVIMGSHPELLVLHHMSLDLQSEILPLTLETFSNLIDVLAI